MAFGDFCQLSDVKAWLQTGQNAFPSTDDALLSRLITAASQFIQSWLGRPVLSADYSEIRDGLGIPRCDTTIVFGVQPVSAVALVVVDNLTIPPVPAVPPAPPGAALTSPYTNLAGYVFTQTELTIRGYPVPRKKACVALQYTAGFAAVPPDLEQAAIELVCRKYRERTRIGERSRRIGEEVVSYTVGAFSLRDMAGDIQTLLQQYRLVAPIFGAVPVMAPTQTDPAILVAAA